ncbi:ice-binding family protein [Streptosporangium sp. V21-05]|uniref:ice-binding family protein n=1 Tax=Streptosporangium sp. V21-05 TaxID=3446115 RepID=UPI003F52A6F8
MGTPVPLGTAAGFAVLGRDSVTNTGTTVVTGDLGVWPGTTLSGFPPGVVNGTVHPSSSRRSPP